MRAVLPFSADDVVPLAEEVLRDQGLPGPEHLASRIRSVLDQALTLHRRLVEPRAVVQEVGPDEFSCVHAGAGPMPDGSVVARIVPRAEVLALYAGTLGEPVGLEIRRLFAAGDPALGYMLDATASMAADRLSYLASSRFLEALGERVTTATRALPYSPGYCGWPTRGQRALFEVLLPEEIGIHLNESFLMWPLKSVSGVIVVAPPDAHAFDADFPFCDDCATHACRERQGALARGERPHGREGREWTC